MSIYSGFPTRKDEGNYNQLLSRLLQLLQTHLLEFVNSNNFSQAKMVVYSRLLIKMRQYEQHKYLPPKFSELMQPLADLIGLPDKTEASYSHQADSGFKTPSLQQKINTASTSFNKFRNKNEKEIHLFNTKEGRHLHQQFQYQESSKDKSKEKLKETDHSWGKSGSGGQKQSKFSSSFYEIQEKKKKQEGNKTQQNEPRKNGKIGGSKFNYRISTQSHGTHISRRLSTQNNSQDSHPLAQWKVLQQAQQILKLGVPKTDILKTEPNLKMVDQ